MAATILVVDDEPDIRAILSQSLEMEGYEVATAVDGRDAIEQYQASPTDLVVTDMRMPKADGLDVLRAVKTRDPLVEVIVLTGYATVKNAVSALKSEGAFHYLTKPLEDIDEFLTTVRNALERRLLRRQNQTLLDRLREKNQALEAETAAVERSRRELEKALDRYASLVNAIPSGVLEFDTSGRIQYANPAYLTIFGKSQDTIVGSSVYELIPDAAQADELRSYIENLAAAAPPPSPTTTTCLTSGGDLIDLQMDWNYAYNRDGEVTGFIAVITDITPQKEANEKRLDLERRLASAQKREAISTLAGGIAHRFNNALAAVLGNLELLEMTSDDEERLRPYIERIKKQTAGMAQQTQKLLAYAQGGRYRAKPIELGAFIRESMPIIRHELETEREIHLAVAADQIDIMVDPTQLELVLSALIQNAVEATEEEGAIWIAADILELAPDTIEGIAEGPCAFLRIEDNGRGMEPEILERLFDPYFSTKFEGRGLGMAAVQGIITNHKGGIQVRSTAGKGTTVAVYLPLTEAPAVESPAPPPQENLEGFNLLIIEDEPALLSACKAMLSDLGCRVWGAPTATSGIEQLTAHEEEIDLVLMDLILPDMGAMALFKALREIKPDLRVVLCSGYSIDGPAQAIIEAGAISFLQKPYSTKSLVASLTQATVGSPRA